MAIYLAEDQVGSDPNLVGFPTLGGCMGLATITNAGIYGFHNPPGHNQRITEFAKLYTGQPASALVSCARWSNRYAGDSAAVGNKFSQWLKEIKEIAGLIGYKGKVIGFDISRVLGGKAALISADDSAYCEFRLDSNGALKIGCSLTSNTKSTTVEDIGTTIRRITGNKASVVPYKSKVVSSVISKVDGFTELKDNKGIYELTI
jgi:hypothetical protein